MNLLPWLLDWPPSRRAVAAVLVVTAFSLGTLTLFGGVTDLGSRGNVTVAATDLTVRLNDEVDLPDAGDGTVRSCPASGTPGDSISVLGDVTVGIPVDRGSPGEGVVIVVSLAHTEETTSVAVEGTGNVTADVFWILEDDETLDAGDTATLRVTVRDADATVTSLTRRVPVEAGSRSDDCDLSGR